MSTEKERETDEENQLPGRQRHRFQVERRGRDWRRAPSHQKGYRKKEKEKEKGKGKGKKKGETGRRDTG